MAMGVAVVMGMVVMVVVGMRVGHPIVLYYNITGVQKWKPIQAPFPLPIQGFDFGENRGE